MSTSLTPKQIEQFKRDATRSKRSKGTTQTAELDAIAQRRGFANWSQLKAHDSPRPELIASPGIRFSRSVADMRLAMLKPKDWIYREDRDAETVRARLQDLSAKFASPIEAVDFAIAYVECLLQVPRHYIHSASQVYFEIRCWLPYCLQEIDGAHRILVNRDYKPMGMVQNDEWVDYKEFANLQVWIPEGDPALPFPPLESHSTSQLYNHSPWRSRTNARVYLAHLLKLRPALVATHEKKPQTN